MRVAIRIPALLLLSLLTACQVGESLCSPVPKFDIDLFVANLETALVDVAGYQVAVNRDGKLYKEVSAGFSIYDVDPGGPISMTVDTRMNVASVSKFIGTIALMQVLEKKMIGIEEPIHTHLPERWKSQVDGGHYDFGSPYLIRFSNLLRMETAIAFAFTGPTFNPGDMLNTQQMLDGLKLSADPTRWGVYQNGNFTLIRVLIAAIEYGLDGGETDFDQQVTDRYYEYIKANIFDKLTLDPPLSVVDINAHFAGTFTRGHQFPFDESYRDGNSELGWPATTNPSLNGGSGGLVLSSMDLAAVAAFFMHHDSLIISPAQRTLMLDQELGFIESVTGDHGRYQSKGGTRGPEKAPAKRALRSRVMIFPNGVEAVLLTNSNLADLDDVISVAYDNAWESDC